MLKPWYVALLLGSASLLEANAQQTAGPRVAVAVALN